MNLENCLNIVEFFIHITPNPYGVIDCMIFYKRGNCYFVRDTIVPNKGKMN